MTVQEDPVVHVPADGARQGHALDVTPDPRKLDDAVGVVDASDLLLDDGAFVEVRVT